MDNKKHGYIFKKYFHLNENKKLLPKSYAHTEGTWFDINLWLFWYYYIYELGLCGKLGQLRIGQCYVSEIKLMSNMNHYMNVFFIKIILKHCNKKILFIKNIIFYESWASRLHLICIYILIFVVYFSLINNLFIVVYNYI